MGGLLIDVGISTAYDYFFEVARPNHDAFTRRPSLLAALNAAWPHWHLHEWYFFDCKPTASKKSFRDHVLHEWPELGWLQDMAEAGKHRELDRKSPPIKVKSTLTRYSGGIGGRAIGEAAVGETVTELVVVDVGGGTRDLRSIMGVAFRYWLGKLLPYPVEICLTPDNRDELANACSSGAGRTSATNGNRNGSGRSSRVPIRRTICSACTSLRSKPRMHSVAGGPVSS